LRVTADELGPYAIALGRFEIGIELRQHGRGVYLVTGAPTRAFAELAEWQAVEGDIVGAKPAQASGTVTYGGFALGRISLTILTRNYI
jgi:hypothetical protein